MAGDTYYFFFSIIAVIAGGLQIANMVYYRLTGATIAGNHYKVNSREYVRLKKMSSWFALTIAAIVTLAFIVNLVLDIHRLLNLNNKQYAHGILIYAPVSCAIATVLMVVSIRNKYKGERPNQPRA